MKKQRKPYRLKKRKDRGGQYVIIDKATGKMEFTGTTDKHEAGSLARVKFGIDDNLQAVFHQKFAEAHLARCNSEWLTNTWDVIVQRMIAGPRGRFGGEKKQSTIKKEKCCWKNACWNGLRHKRVIDTVANDFQEALKNVGVTLVEFGRKFHNYAMNHRLIPYAIMGKEMWPKIETNPLSRSITEGEHLTIVGCLSNPSLKVYNEHTNKHQNTTPEMWRDEWVNWLWFLWFTGASSADAANMKAECVRWVEGVLEYKRGKWIWPEKHAPVRVAIAKGGQLEKLLKRLPVEGHLFPLLSLRQSDERAKTFARVIDCLGIPKVTIHGYRFAFAERARKAGMSAEDRMASLGHADYDTHHHYDKNAMVVPVSIEVLDGGLKMAL